MNDLVRDDPAALPAIFSPIHPARNPYHVYLDSLQSQESTRTMKGCLGRIAAILTEGSGEEIPAEAIPWGSIRFAHAARIKKKLTTRTRLVDGEARPLAPAYINAHLSALRGVLDASHSLGYIDGDELARIRKAVVNVSGTRLPAGRNLAAAEQAAMLRACPRDTLLGARNAAVIALLCATGLRRAEVATARREHYDPGERALRVIGKGDRQREVYVNEDAAVYIGSWLAKLDGRTGPLFVPVDRWGRLLNRHLTPRAIGVIIDEVRRAAGLPRLTPHDFRRTFIGDLLDDGTDLATAQALVGHSSPATTAGYDRRPAAARKAAANRLRLPRPDEL